MNLPKVGIVHGPYGAATITDIARAARDLCHPVILFTRETSQRHPRVVEVTRKLFEVEVTDHIGHCVAKRGLAGITTFHDTFIEAVEECLPHRTRAWDKLIQRQTLHSAGLSRARAFPVDAPQDLASAVHEIGFPAVLKPRRGVGGVGVAFLRGPEDVRYQTANRRRWSGLLVETMLADGCHPCGTEYLADFVSVETASTGDSHGHLAAFDKLAVVVKRRAGADGADAVHVTGDVTPCRLSRGDYDRVVEHVSDCLAALDIRWRVTHTEVKLTPHGPEIIEINGRVGGHLNRLLRLVNGPDLVRAALCLALGREPVLSAGKTHGYAAGVFPPFPSREGVVRSRVCHADLRALPAVVGVDEIAVAGLPRQLTNYLMANVTMFAERAEDLDLALPATLKGIAGLFAQDHS